MEPTIYTEIAKNGIAGLALVWLGVAYLRKDKEHRAEMHARIEDAKEYTNMAIALQGQLINAVNKLTEVFEDIKKNGRRQ